MSSLRELQKESIRQMLCLDKPPKRTHSDAHSSSDCSGRWRVLVYDKVCSDIISPLFTVHELRDMGITLHMLLETKREQIRDIDAIYFIAPSNHSISSPVKRELLELFARQYVEKGCTSDVRIIERTLDYVSLENNLFLLNDKRSFVKVHGKQDDEAIERYLNRCADTLYSIVRCVGNDIHIRYLRNGPSEYICKLLHEKYSRDQLNISNLFRQPNLTGVIQRSLLIVLDRDLDMAQVMRHTSTYQALLDDVIGLKMNRITISKGETISYASGTLDKVADKFYREQAGKPFPDVVEALEIERKNLINREYSIKQKSQKTTGNSSMLHEAIVDLESFENAKNRINFHYKLLEALVDEITARDIPTYFDVEQKIANGIPIPKDDVVRIIKHNKGSFMDKLRLTCLCILSPLRDQDLASAAIEALSDAGVIPAEKKNMSTKKIYESLSRFSTHAVKSSAPLSETVESGGTWVSSVIKQGSDLVKHWLPKSQNNTKLGEICSDVVSHKEINPALKLESKTISFANSAKGRQELQLSEEVYRYKYVVVFIVGGITYTEFNNILEKLLVKHPGVQVLVGSTEILTAEEFLSQLSSL